MTCQLWKVFCLHPPFHNAKPFCSGKMDCHGGPGPSWLKRRSRCRYIDSLGKGCFGLLKAVGRRFRSQLECWKRSWSSKGGWVGREASTSLRCAKPW